MQRRFLSTIALLGITLTVAPLSQLRAEDNSLLWLTVQNGVGDQPERESEKAADLRSPQVALIVAAARGNMDVVKRALEQGAMINGQGPAKHTALMAAALQGHLEVVQYLVAHNADVNARSLRGSTALILAARRWHEDVVRFLLDHGADVNAGTNFQVTALLAVLSGEGLIYDETLNVYAPKQIEISPATIPHVLQLIALLLDRGADINNRNMKGKTALRLAVETGQRELVQLLLQRGARVSGKARDGQTPLMVAQVQNHPEIVQLLQQAGARR